MSVNLPNTITLLRVALIPIFVVAFYLPSSWNYLFAASIFLFASITDWADGYLARTLQQTSKFGAFLDPVADKLIVSVALVLIVGENWVPYLAIPAAVIIGREIVISALREWMAEVGKRSNVSVGCLGKIKTAMQMIAITTLLLHFPSLPWLTLIGSALLYLAAFLTLFSMCIYLYAARKALAE